MIVATARKHFCSLKSPNFIRTWHIIFLHHPLLPLLLPCHFPQSQQQISPQQVKLEEVETKSGEEDEEILCSYRSKLFLYGETLLDQGTGNKTWKERGIGEARILRHREHQRLRFLMRQEKTMKVIANHALDPRIKLEPNAGSDRSWVWSCFDFAEGQLEEKVFALRFSNSEVANEFKEKYEECQKEMECLLKGEDSKTGGEEAEEAAEAFKGLKTGDEWIVQCHVTPKAHLYLYLPHLTDGSIEIAVNGDEFCGDGDVCRSGNNVIASAMRLNCWSGDWVF